MKHVLDLSNNKRVDVESLGTLMTTVEESASKSANSASHCVEGHDIFAGQADTCHSVTNSSEVPSFSSKGDNANTHSNASMTDTSEEPGPSESHLLEPRECELLMDMLGSILAQIVKNGGGADIWGLYARWHKIKGNLTMCSKALLKQVRSYQESDLWHDQDRFKEFAHVSLRLCKVYMEIASSLGIRRELMTAEMHLRNSVKQAVKFSDAEEYRDLQACHEEITKSLAATSAGA